jgi:hypothetical protein
MFFTSVMMAAVGFDTGSSAIDCPSSWTDVAILRSEVVVDREGFIGVSAGKVLSKSSLDPCREGVPLEGVNGTAGRICETVRCMLALLDGREPGREAVPSKSGSA